MIDKNLGDFMKEFRSNNSSNESLHGTSSHGERAKELDKDFHRFLGNKEEDHASSVIAGLSNKDSGEMKDIKLQVQDQISTSSHKKNREPFTPNPETRGKIPDLKPAGLPGQRWAEALFKPKKAEAYKSITGKKALEKPHTLDFVKCIETHFDQAQQFIESNKDLLRLSSEAQGKYNRLCESS